MRRNEEHMADFTFSTLKYERPDFKELELLFEDLVKQVQEAVSYEGLKHDCVHPPYIRYDGYLL